MGRLGYTGHTVQLVAVKGKHFVFFWSPSPVADKIDKYVDTLDYMLENMEEDPTVYYDKWDYKGDDHE